MLTSIDLLVNCKYFIINLLNLKKMTTHQKINVRVELRSTFMLNDFYCFAYKSEKLSLQKACYLSCKGICINILYF